MADDIAIYTDGACRGNPGPGGWGFLLRRGVHEKECCGGEAETTNNRMELTAVIRALEALKRPITATIYSDSQYVIKGISEWLPDWKKHGWKTSQRQAVKNTDLWQKLDALAALHQLNWQWIRGHAGNPDNERVDALARQGLVASITSSSAT